MIHAPRSTLAAILHPVVRAPSIDVWLPNRGTVGISPVGNSFNLFNPRDTCACLPKMCADEVVLKGKATVVTYICPVTSTTAHDQSTIFITVTEYTTVTPTTTLVTPKTSAAATVVVTPVPAIARFVV